MSQEHICPLSSSMKKKVTNKIKFHVYHMILIPNKVNQVEYHFKAHTKHIIHNNN